LYLLVLIEIYQDRRPDQLLEVIRQLLAHHYNHHLNKRLRQTVVAVAELIQVLIARDHRPFEEGHVKDRTVEVGELKHVDLDRERCLVLGVGFVMLHVGQLHRDPFVKLPEHYDDHQVDASACDRGHGTRE